MTKKEYLAKLLKLCTDKQLFLFSKMYPAGVKGKFQTDIATRQVERTLTELNQTREDIKGIQENAANTAQILKDDIVKFNDLVVELENEISQQKIRIQHLETPSSLKQADIQDRLAWLEALEAAGVDNWVGYEMAQEMMSEQE